MNGAVICRVAEGEDRLGGAAVRLAVFVAEQNVPFVLEIDARDFLDTTIHVVAVDARTGHAVGAGRLLCDGGGRYHVGRVAVLAPWRGLGVGRELMTTLQGAAQQQEPVGGSVHLTLDAQERAIGFYESLGYRRTDRERFLDAGIWHQEMELTVGGRKAMEDSEQPGTAGSSRAD